MRRESIGPRRRSRLRIATTAVLLISLTACGGHGGGGGGSPPSPPGISAELDSVVPGSTPLGPSATVSVVDPATGNTISNASVTLNNIALAYDATSQQYVGDVQVSYGASISLNVSVGGRSYGVTATQFTSYPSITAPTSGTVINTSDTNLVSWSSGAPTTSASYALAILDAASLTNDIVWPLDHTLHVEPVSANSFSITPGNITAGNRLVIVGIVQTVSITSAAQGSALYLIGYDDAPISVTGMPVTTRASGTTNRLSGVVWSGSQFVAVGDNGTIVTSSDGTTWVSRPSGTTDMLEGVVWTGTEYIAVGGTGTVLTSLDGAAWTRHSLGTSNLYYGVAWSGATAVAVGFNGAISSSPDGVTWTPRVSGAPNEIFQGVAWSGSQFVAVSRAGAILTSPDGGTWTSQANGGGLWGVTSSGTQLVAVGYSSASCCIDVILTSPDGVTWTPQSTNVGALPMAVTWTGQQYLAVGGSGALGTMRSSPDGINWKSEATGSQAVLFGVASSGSTVVAVGDNGTIVTSP